MINTTKLYKHLLGFTLMISMISCGENAFETTLEIDPPEHTPQLVVHAYASTENGDINVQVSESKGLLDNSLPLNISSAIVTIWKGTDLVTTVPEISTSTFNFNYVLNNTNIQFEAGEEYRIEVVAAGYPKAIGLCTVPLTTNLDQITFEEDGPTTNDSEENSELELDFQDQLGIENFYELIPLIFEQNGAGPSYYREIRAFSFDPATEEGFNYASIIMNDQSFDGEAKNLSVIIEKLSPNVVEEQLFISWRNTTRDHYLFNRTARSQDNQNGNPFSSPIQVYSNMENGIGIFSIVNEQIIKVKP